MNYKVLNIRKYTALLMFLLVGLSVFSQTEPNLKHTWKWYFGANAGIDFSSGEPLPLTDGVAKSAEAVFTVNDDNGDLLFYGQHDSVFNKNHQFMDNGHFTSGDWPTQIQCIKQPGNDSLYYIFHTNYNTPPLYLEYAIVDINASGGLGAVISQNNLIETSMTEGIGAVLHCNGEDVWIVGKQLGTKDLMAWLFTSNGVSSTSVVSNNVVQINYNENQSTNFKFSPDNSMAVASYLNSGNPSNWGNSEFELYQFDNCTGIFSNAISLPQPCAYGISFSPDNSKLYLGSTFDCIVGAFSGDKELIQYDISNYDEISILSSKYVIASDQIKGFDDMQIGPDGKIYICDTDTLKPDYGWTHLGVIQNPNAGGVNCSYIADTIGFDGFISPNEDFYTSRMHIAGLPHFLQHYFNGLISNVGLNIEEQQTISVYPNPFEKQFTIENQDQINIQYTLFDVAGQIIEKDVTQSKQEIINTSKLRKGVYFIQIQNKNNFYSKTFKIMKL